MLIIKCFSSLYLLMTVCLTFSFVELRFYGQNCQFVCGAEAATKLWNTPSAYAYFITNIHVTSEKGVGKLSFFSSTVIDKYGYIQIKISKKNEKQDYFSWNYFKCKQKYYSHFVYK